MAQYWCELYLWEYILNLNPQFEKIVELGTWQGGFSIYLDMQAKVRDLKFVTYDAIDFGTKAHKIVSFEKKDIFAEAEFIGEFIANSSTLLFCDNGNKAREIETFAPWLTNDSMLVVHDWLTEVFPDDIPDYLEIVYPKECEEIGSMSRVFRKKVFH